MGDGKDDLSNAEIMMVEQFMGQFTEKLIPPLKKISKK